MILVFSLLVLNVIYGRENIKESENLKNQRIKKNENYEIEALHREIGLEGKLSLEAFKNGFLGFKQFEDRKKNILTIIDFSKSSLQERFFVIDLDRKKILFNTTVAHGKNSGDDIPNRFSNKINSNQSSPGFYMTEGTYFGGNGYSLVLDGLEKGINDKAKERYIVVHGADYAKPIKGASRLGRSLGCPAIPKELNKDVIDTIKNGSILYVHTSNLSYNFSNAALQI